MIQTSEAFGKQMGSNARKIHVRFLLNGIAIEGNIKEVEVNKGACGDGEFTVGSIYSSYITATVDDCPVKLENEELELQMGLELPDGTVEYCTVGFYAVSDVDTSVGSTTFTGLGRLSAKFGGSYFSDQSWPQSVQSVLNEISQQTGVSIDASAWDSSVLSLDIEASMNGLLHREAVMYIAGLLGGFATETNTGGIVIRPFSDAPVVEVDADRTTEMYAFNDYDYSITGVTVLVSAGGETEDGETVDEVSYSYGTPNLTLSNPYMTKALFDLMAKKLTGYTYRPGTVPISMGDIRLEAGDAVTVVDSVGETYVVPCLNLVHTYDGGLMTTVTAPGDSTTEQEAVFAGALSVAVERTATELLVVKKVVATKIEAVEANLETLTSENAEIKNAVIKKADITDLNAANAEIEKLQAKDAEMEQAIIQKADITDLNAANASITSLTANVANISALLAGTAGVGTLQAIHITGDNVVIDDAIITDAMIAGLTASKITAGTIYTSLVKIASDQEENLLIDGSTIQIKDTNGIVRVQIGKDSNGDYSYYLWDAAGNLMWNPTGVTEAGLNAGIIKDAAIADDANINQSKIDMQSVAERLNEDGSIEVDSSRVKLDGTSLDVAYQTIITKTEDTASALDTLKSDSVADVTPYYAVGTSPDVPPSEPGTSSGSGGSGGRAPALVGQAVVGESLVGDAVGDTGGWTTAQPVVGDGAYLWMAYLLEYLDGSVKWTAPTLVTDTTLREKTTTLQTELSVVQGQIKSKVWQTDITDAIDPLGNQVTALEDNYSTINQTVQGIRTEVGDVQTTLATKADGSTVTAMDSRVSTVEQTASGLTIRVTATEEAIDNLEIGGRNLQLGSEAWLDSAFYSIGDASISEGALSVPIGNIKTETHFIAVALGDEFTVSFDIKSDTDYTGDTLLLEFFDSAGNRTSYQYVTGTVSTTWQRISETFSVTDAAAAQMRMGLRSKQHQNTYRLLKIERGNTPTDWTPAPEDTVQKATLISEINQSAEEIRIKASKISLEGIVTANSYFKILDDGSLEATNAAISGKVTASEGTIGGWTISENALYQTATDSDGNPVYSVLRVPKYGNYSIGLGASELNDLSTAAFRVAYDGRMYAQKMFLDNVDSCLYVRSGLSEGDSGYTEDSRWIRAICGPYGADDPATAVNIAPGGGNVIFGGLHKIHSGGMLLNGLLQCETIDNYATTTASYAAFDSNGYLKKRGSSSRRYKYHIQDLNDFSYEDVLKIPVRQFIYNPGYLTEGDPCENKTIPGLIAEEVGAVFPAAAIKDKHGEYENWDDRMILVMLLKAVQEQSKRISELEKQCFGR